VAMLPVWARVNVIRGSRRRDLAKSRVRDGAMDGKEEDIDIT